LNVNVTAVLQSKTSSGSTWRIFATSPAGSATGAQVQTAVGTGLLSYDTNGNLISTTNPAFTIDRSNTGAQPNLTVAMDFSRTSALSGPQACCRKAPTTAPSPAP
jgi:flagellar hook protein FlgE